MACLRLLGRNKERITNFKKLGRIRPATAHKMQAMQKEEVLQKISEYFIEPIQIPWEKIKLKAHLFKALEMDSIDTVD